ncbi:MAG: sugar transferase, partial [candidate division WOR-3 bacterium]
MFDSTMVADAARRGPGITPDADPRITRVGGILRKLKIDEMPQLINVLKGEMSIVGPRPELPKYVALYPDEYREILRVRPGLTSLAQIVYREEESLLPEQETERYYITHILPRKLALDLHYVRRWSLLLDFKVFALGVLALLKVRPPTWLWPVVGPAEGAEGSDLRLGLLYGCRPDLAPFPGSGRLPPLGPPSGLR